MPITTSGYNSRRFPEIKESSRSSLANQLGTDVRSSPDSVIGTLLSVIGREIASQEALNQAMYSSLDLDKAEGVQLDRIVAYIGLTRLAASNATGQLRVWRNSEGTLFSAPLFRDVNNVEYVAINGLQHSLLECSEVLVTPTTVTDNTEYTIVLNGFNYSFTSGVGATASEVVTGLADEINNASADITAVVETNNLRITADLEDQNSLSVNYNQFSLIEIATFNFVQSVDVGSIQVSENTITTIVSTNPTLLRCNNPLPFVDGRESETDEELRIRHKQSVAVGGNATIPAIRAAILDLANVNSAIILENDQIIQVGDLPAKSYQCVVEGGSPLEIAQTIWDTKPAGVETYGDITTLVEDASENQQSVKWSRPTPIYLHVRVTYELYDEEVFPLNGEDLIADSVLAYGDSLEIGKDVIPKRFIGGVYQSVNGLGDVTVEIGTSASPTATTPDSGWLTTTVSIATGEFASFALGRIVVQAAP